MLSLTTAISLPKINKGGLTWMIADTQKQNENNDVIINRVLGAVGFPDNKPIKKDAYKYCERIVTEFGDDITYAQLIKLLSAFKSGYDCAIWDIVHKVNNRFGWNIGHRLNGYSLWGSFKTWWQSKKLLN